MDFQKSKRTKVLFPLHAWEEGREGWALSSLGFTSRPTSPGPHTTLISWGSVKARSSPLSPADQLLSISDRKPPALLPHNRGQEGPAAGGEASGARHWVSTPSQRHKHWLTPKEGPKKYLFCQTKIYVSLFLKRWPKTFINLKEVTNWSLTCSSFSDTIFSVSAQAASFLEHRGKGSSGHCLAL